MSGKSGDTVDGKESSENTNKMTKDKTTYANIILPLVVSSVFVILSLLLVLSLDALTSLVLSELSLIFINK